MPPLLQADGLTKRYGRVLALDHLSLEVEAGEAVGFLGPNGAGKTTTIRLLLDLIRPTAGSARIGGYDCHRQGIEARRLIGYLPGEMPIYPELSGRAYLAYLGRLGTPAPSGASIERLLRRFEVGPSLLDRPMRDLSHGTKRKLGLVQALMGDPRIAILDEPTSGLDPLMIEAFAETVHELKRDGRTAVFLSSHVLSEVEKTCDRVAIVLDGRLLAVRTIRELSDLVPRRVTLRFESGSERFLAANVGMAQRSGPETVVADVVGPLGPLLGRIAGLPVADIDVRTPSLEDYVLGLYRGAPGGSAGLPPPPRLRRTRRSFSEGGQTREQRSDQTRDELAAAPRGPGIRPREIQPSVVAGPAASARHMLPALVLRSVARSRRLLGAAVLVLALFQVMLVAIASSFQETRSFDLLSALMPMGVQQSLGAGALALASFAGMVTFGYFHPIVVLAVVQLAVYVATEPAGEVEWGLFDLQLARPVRRRTMATRTVVVAAGASTIAAAAMMTGTWAGLWLLAPAGAPWPRTGRVVSLAAHLLLLSWVFAGAGLAAASFVRRRGTAFGAVAGLAVVLYLLNFLADAWPRLAALRPWNPFHYFPGFSVANGVAPIARDVATLLAVAAGLTAMAYWRFERRDL